MLGLNAVKCVLPNGRLAGDELEQRTFFRTACQMKGSSTVDVVLLVSPGAMSYNMTMLETCPTTTVQCYSSCHSNIPAKQRIEGSSDSDISAGQIELY
jgi:hypothetical protein